MATKQQSKGALFDKLVIPLTVVLVLVAVGIFFVKKHNSGHGEDSLAKAVGAIGTEPAIAGCADNPPTNDKLVASSIVPAGTKATYPVVPPSSGAHLAQAVNVNADAFYTATDRPPMEGLVANLAAGWTVIFYDPVSLQSTGPDQVADLKKAITTLHKDSRYSNIVASEWDKSYGNLPPGTPIALVRQNAEGGHRAFCHEVSGEAIREFMVFYGAPKIAGADPE